MAIPKRSRTTAWREARSSYLGPTIEKWLEGAGPAVKAIPPRLKASSKYANVIVTAIAREMLAFMWAIAKEVPVKA